MKAFTRSIFAGSALSLLFFVSAQAQSGGLCGSWNLVPSPNPVSGFSRLNAVAVVSSRDVWAVGEYRLSNGILQTLAEHWDGASWNIVPTPNTGNTDNTLDGVVALASNNVWAVGSSSDFGKAQMLVEHWEGSSWQIASTPTNSGGAFLTAIAAVSGSDIWAVGEQTLGAPDASFGTLTLHWDGSSWSVVASPNVADRTNVLNGITVVSANDIWAVGTPRKSGGLYTTLTLHWDGTSWSVIPSPNVGFYSQLFAAVAVGSNDVWATGIGTDANANVQPLFLHWDGGTWGTVPSPGGVQAFLGGRNGLAVISSSDAWSVGDTIAHWNGANWSLVPGAPNAPNGTLSGAAKAASCDVWAVGSLSGVTLIERLQPMFLSSLTLNPSIVKGGDFSTGTLTFNGPAPAGGAVVTLTSNKKAAAVPPSVTVPEGATSATFTVTTKVVLFKKVVRISASYAGVTKTAKLTLMP